jgi:hypothetical protein
MNCKVVRYARNSAHTSHVGAFTNKDCMYFGALVGEYYFCIQHNTQDVHYNLETRALHTH